MKRPKRGWEEGYKAVKCQDPRAKQYLDAAKAGDSARVAELLDAGIDDDARDSIGWTALMMATRGRHIVLMRQLIDRGARLDFENSSDYTALTIATIEATSGRKRTPDRRPLDLLLEIGMAPTLHEAVYLDDLDLARRRLEEGDDPDTAEGCYQGPILMKAADDGNLLLVDLLLDLGANIEAMDDLGRRPLLSAAGHGRTEVVHRLLERSADLDARSWSDQTALSAAASGGHLDLALWLIERSARRGIVDAMLLGERDLFRKLLDARLADGCHIDHLSDGQFPLAVIAARRGDIESLRVLLDRGADIEGKAYTHRLLLAEAARHGRLDVIRLLLDRGADLHAVGKDGLTPLASAILGNQAEAAALLRRAGASR